LMCYIEIVVIANSEVHIAARKCICKT